MALFPSLPLYTDAIVADCVHLSDAEFGLYMRILIQTWRNPGCRIPADSIWLARKFQRDYETAILPILEEFFSSTGNWWSQKRLSEQFNYVEDKRKKQTVRANTRWNKEKDLFHGNAGKHAGGNAPKPKPILKEKNLTKKEEINLPDWMPLELWNAWLEVRKKRKAPNTSKALELAVKKLEEFRVAGYSVTALIESAVVSGWLSFTPRKAQETNKISH